MQRYLAFATLVVVTCSQAGAQFSQGATISNAVANPQDVYAEDLDGDGDLDVLSASQFDNKIAWYENLSGAFGSQRIVSTSCRSASAVYATDLDGDGDADVLAVSNLDQEVYWYENLGGGSFGPQQVITSAANGATSVYATDLDGDGDADVLSASSLDDKIAWYENLGGSFGPQQVITTSADGANSVYAADLDGDGDADVLSSSFTVSDSRIAWYENLGGGSFSALRTVTALVPRARSVYAADLDGDGDLDVVGAGGNLSWCPNFGGGVFGVPQVVYPANGDFILSVRAADLDGDSNVDLVTGSNLAGLAWFQNQGGGSFSTDLNLSGFSGTVSATCSRDLDLDGDVDIVAANNGFFTGSSISQFENLTSPGTPFCSPAVVNSTGTYARLYSVGSPSIAANNLTLNLRDLPRNQFAIFFVSQTQTTVFPVPGSQGVLCLSNVGRYDNADEIVSSGTTGTASIPVDLRAIPTPQGITAALPGQTWGFQAWYRDVNPTVTSNFSTGLSIMFQ